MKIFDKRPLSLILCILLGGFVIFSFDNTLFRSILAISAVLLLILSRVLFLKSRHRVMLFLSSITVIISILLSYLYFDLWFKVYERFDGEVEIKGTVVEMKSSSYGSTTYVIKTDSINDEPLTKYKIMLNLSEEDSQGIILGTKINFDARLCSFAYGLDYDNTNYNFSRGISARTEDVENLKIIEQTGTSLTESISFLRQFITRHAIMLSDNETGTLLCALLFGERDALSPQVRLDFKRIGISHILALSGMHLTILSLGLAYLLSAMRIKKRPRTLIVIIFTLVYMGFTGFSVSVVRAGIMLIIASVLYLISQTHDSVTSLFLAVVIICSITPYAIYDTALWLSALATLGVIMSGEYCATLPKTKSIPKKVLRFILASFLTTVFALGATFIITSITFGAFSLAAPPATLIFSILVEIIMYIGSFMLIFGSFIPVHYILTPIASFTLSLADIMSQNRYIYISTSYTPLIVTIVIFSLLLYLFIVLNIKHRKIAMCILMASFFSIYAVSGIIIYNEANTEDIVYTQESKYDAFILKSEKEVALIESSQYSISFAYTSLDFLEKEKVTYLDVYYATHYSWALEDTLETLLANVIIEEIYLPVPLNEDEELILQRLYKTITDTNTEIKFYNQIGKVRVGNLEISSLLSIPYGEGSSTNAFKIKDGNTTYTYLSSGMMTSKYEDITYKEIITSEVLVFGSHGKKYSENTYMTDKYVNKRMIILSSNYYYMDQSTLKFYEKYGCEVYSHPQSISIYRSN